MASALDMALATLAAIAVDRVIKGGIEARAIDTSSQLGVAFSHAVKRSLTRVLPLAMVGALSIFAGVAWLFRGGAGALGTQFAGSAKDALARVSRPQIRRSGCSSRCLRRASPAVSGGWKARKTRAGARADLAGGFVHGDGFRGFTGQGAPVVSDWSPAAGWLAEYAPVKDSYRIWGISDNYHHRPDELLLPKTCGAMGFKIAGRLWTISVAALRASFWF